MLENIDAEAEPDQVFYQRQANAVRQRLQHDPPTDPNLRARLERDRVAWERAAAAATLDEHWAAGEGDRTLF